MSVFLVVPLLLWYGVLRNLASASAVAEPAEKCVVFREVDKMMMTCGSAFSDVTTLMATLYYILYQPKHELGYHLGSVGSAWRSDFQRKNSLLFGFVARDPEG